MCRDEPLPLRLGGQRASYRESDLIRESAAAADILYEVVDAFRRDFNQDTKINFSFSRYYASLREVFEVIHLLERSRSRLFLLRPQR